MRDSANESSLAAKTTTCWSIAACLIPFVLTVFGLRPLARICSETVYISSSLRYTNMSSSEDEAVRRPARGGRAYNGDVSDDDNADISAPENDQADNNDDKDLFGSDSEPDLDECAQSSLEHWRDTC